MSEKLQKHTHSQGVGGRQIDTTEPFPLSWYLDICSDLNYGDLKRVFAYDPWLKIVEQIGVENFVKMAYILAPHERISNPSLNGLRRAYQNKLILSMAADGMSGCQIHNHLVKTEQKPPSLSYIHKLLKQ